MSEQSATSKASPAPQNTGFALGVLATVFFIFGFATAFKDSLVPHLKNIFLLSQSSADLIQFFFFLAYLIISIPSTIVVAKMGHQKSIVVGVAIMAVGSLLIPPAAISLQYWLFLVALWVISAGITLIQVAANPFATLLGAPEKAPARLTMVQAFNSLGTTVAPLLGGLLILTNKAQEATMTAADKASTVKLPYLGLAILLLILAIIIWRLKMPQPERETASGGAWGEIWKHPHLVFGIIAIFLYVGAEVTIGGHLVNYIHGTVPSVSEQDASKFFVPFYWGGAMVGRFLGVLVLRRFSGGKVLGVCGTIALALILATMTTGGMVAVWSAVLVGLFNSIMFPTAFALAVNKLGPLTGKASGLLNMAIFGGAVIPLVQGVLIDRAGRAVGDLPLTPEQVSAFHFSFVVPLICYLFIMFYGFRGSRVKEA